MRSYPESYPKKGKRSRGCLVSTFPYGIIYKYREKQNTILVLAIAHLHRKPEYCSARNTLLPDNAMNPDNLQFVECTRDDASELAELRARAMEPSLRKVGRFDEQRVRSRFLDSFVTENTRKIVADDVLCGFYVLKRNSDHHYLDHLYVDPEFQGQGIGHAVMREVLRESEASGLPVRLGALRESRANEFAG